MKPFLLHWKHGHSLFFLHTSWALLPDFINKLVVKTIQANCNTIHFVSNPYFCSRVGITNSNDRLCELCLCLCIQGTLHSVWCSQLGLNDPEYTAALNHPCSPPSEPRGLQTEQIQITNQILLICQPRTKAIVYVSCKVKQAECFLFHHLFLFQAKKSYS